MSLAFANQGAAKRCGNQPSFDHWGRLAKAVREIFPSKTAWHLSDISGLRLRACEYFLSRKTSLSGDAIVTLLRSKEGLRVLEALMGDARPEWWASLQKGIQKERYEREIEQIRKRMEAL